MDRTALAGGLFQRFGLQSLVNWLDFYSVQVFFRVKGSELVGLGACWSIRLGAPSLGSRLGWSRLHRLVRPLLLPARKSSSQGLETGKGEMPGLEGEVRLPRLQGDSCTHKFRKVDQTLAASGFGE